MSSKERCKRCGDTFGSRRALAQHYKAKHPSIYYTSRLAPLIAIISVVAIAIALTPMGVREGSHDGVEVLDFTLKKINQEGLTEELFTLSDVRGKVIFLDFVFSWCPHCNEMAPIIKRLHDEYSKRGVFFLTIAGRDARADEYETASFLKRHNVTWTAVFDEKLEVFKLFRVRGTPTYVVIDRDFRVAGKLVGEQEYDELAGLINKSLR